MRSVLFHIRWSLMNVAGDSEPARSDRLPCPVPGCLTQDGRNRWRFCWSARCRTFAFPAHPSARAAWSSSHTPPPSRGHTTQSATPLSPGWAPLLVLVASSTAPAERSSDAQGCGRDFLGGRVQLNGYWKRLATALDPLVAAPSGKPLHSHPWARGTASERTRADVQAMVAATHGGPGLRSAPLLRAGMQRLQQRHGLERLRA
jgi:hypothetical protein